MADGLADGLAVLAAAGALDSAKNTPMASPVHRSTSDRTGLTPDSLHHFSQSLSPSHRSHSLQNPQHFTSTPQYHSQYPQSPQLHFDSASSPMDIPDPANKPQPLHNGLETDPDVRIEKGCNCKNSKCLKLYCECFAKNLTCGPHCNCRNCRNNGNFPSEKRLATEAILERNPNAFQPKVKRKQGGGLTGLPAREKHQKGCNCRKSGCLKRYCECFQASVLCSELCKCVNCRNFEGSSAVTIARGGANGKGGSFDRSMSPQTRKPPLLAPAPVPHSHGMHASSGKRVAPHMKNLVEPPAKRVLFQKGPALKSRLDSLGTPGGLHYETSEMYEDHPDNMLAAASKALDPKIVTDAKKYTDLLFRLFVDAAAETGEASHSFHQENGERIQRSSMSRGGLSDGNRHDSVSLMCEEDGLDDDGGSAETRPTWYAETEKKALELCAKSLYVISSASRRNTQDLLSAKRRKSQATRSFQ